MTALLVTLATPATWPLALATFLVRGGVILVLLPIVVLPTTVGLGNTLRADAHVRRVRVGPAPGHRGRRRGRARRARLAGRRGLAGGGTGGRGSPDRGARRGGRRARGVGGISCGRDGDILRPGRGADPRGAADRVRAARRGPGPGFDPPGLRDLPGAHQSARREHPDRASRPARRSRGRRRRGRRLDARRDRRGRGCPADRPGRCARRRSTRRRHRRSSSGSPSRPLPAS